MKRMLLILAAAVLMIPAAREARASVIYTPMNLTANQTATWNWFSFGVDADGFGLWVNVGASLRLETYLSPVIGVEEEGKVFLTGLGYGTEIGSGSAWATPAAPTYINDATHQALNGQTFYVGVQLVDASSVLYYGWMHLSVAEDGLSVTLHGMAYQDEAGASLMAGVIDRQVYFSGPGFVEDLVTNDGTIANALHVNLEGVDFAISTGAMAEGTHFTVANLPAGLSIEVSVNDARNAVIVLNGQAGSHAESDARYDLTLSFLDEAFTGAAASEVIDATRDDLEVKFFDPYKIIHDDLGGLVCGTGGWVPFSNDYYGNTFGLWHDGTDMRLESYGRSVVGTISAGRSLITPLDEGTVINSESAWVETGNWPNEGYINSATYTSWNGKRKYAGVQLVVGEAVLYGWLELEVSADGRSMTIYEWAFNTRPQGAITAGETTSGIIGAANEKISVSVTPNPFSSQLNIQLSQALKEAASVEILDLTGRTVAREKVGGPGATRLAIGTGGLQRGVYFVRVSSTGVNSTLKVIKD
ncbi:MAG: T9SS type A sorting domain-containing protein [Bacteroidales bacterium]